MKKLQIGNVTLDNLVILAPMAGVSDLPFRLLCRGDGSGAGVHGNGQCQSHIL